MKMHFQGQVMASPAPGNGFTGVGLLPALINSYLELRKLGASSAPVPANVVSTALKTVSVVVSIANFLYFACDGGFCVDATRSINFLSVDKKEQHRAKIRAYM